MMDVRPLGCFRWCGRCNFGQAQQDPACSNDRLTVNQVAQVTGEAKRGFAVVFYCNNLPQT